jgi:hypothetical protein
MVTYPLILKADEKFSLCLTNLVQCRKDIGGEWSYRSIILDSAIIRRRVISFTPLPLYPGEITPGIRWMGGWVGPIAGLNDFPTPGIEPRPCSP